VVHRVQANQQHYSKRSPLTCTKFEQLLRVRHKCRLLGAIRRQLWLAGSSSNGLPQPSNTSLRQDSIRSVAGEHSFQFVQFVQFVAAIGILMVSDIVMASGIIMYQPPKAWGLQRCTLRAFSSSTGSSLPGAGTPAGFLATTAGFRPTACNKMSQPSPATGVCLFLGLAAACPHCHHEALSHIHSALAASLCPRTSSMSSAGTTFPKRSGWHLLQEVAQRRRRRRRRGSGRCGPAG
jgi:hypothetical protein